MTSQLQPGTRVIFKTTVLGFLGEVLHVGRIDDIDGTHYTIKEEGKEDSLPWAIPKEWVIEYPESFEIDEVLLKAKMVDEITVNIFNKYLRGVNPSKPGYEPGDKVITCLRPENIDERTLVGTAVVIGDEVPSKAVHGESMSKEFPSFFVKIQLLGSKTGFEDEKGPVVVVPKYFVIPYPEKFWKNNKGKKIGTMIHDTTLHVDPGRSR
jgi:hypothetical protein